MITLEKYSLLKTFIEMNEFDQKYEKLKNVTLEKHI